MMGAKAITAKGDHALKAVVPVDLTAVEVELKVFSLPEDGIQVSFVCLNVCVCYCVCCV